MFRQILSDSVTVLFQNPKLIRLSFLTLVFYSIVRIYFIVYYFNTFLLYKYESGVQLSDAFIYVLDKLNNQGILRAVIGVIIVLIGYLWFHPIGEASVVSALDNPQQSAFRSFVRGSGKFFPMLEYSGLSIPFGVFTFCTVMLRLYLMDIFDNIFITIIVGIRGFLVLFASVCWSYARIIIALEGCQVFDAIKKSTSLAMNNLGLSVKLMFVELLLMLRFIVIGLLIVGIPVLLIYIAVWLDVIQNSFVETTIRVVAASLLLVIAYLNCIVEAFFLTYWYQAYRKISPKT
ncbi:MAG: hypothetical protein HXJ92_03005 [candidate division SR1 bacterium]|nr:hypothetical protein [candidate division SR1 bacterium]MBF0932348.1 hypothetical protein [candidate division SR1 bacterium]RKW20973.1 MAG: hypothetical protein D8B45_06700 [Candidatus Gracilibacteria bacterium]